MSHFKNIEKLIGPLKNKKILDIGAGYDEFIFDCLRGGAIYQGIEINHDKIDRSIKRGAELGFRPDIVLGDVLEIPLNDDEFDFVNVNEVIEHVADPELLLDKVARTLKPGGYSYVSVHNRYAWYDKHFHVYFLGWMPRSWAEAYLRLLGKRKDYEKTGDIQRISQMHYYSYKNFLSLAEGKGFSVKDIREIKIRQKFSGIALSFVLMTYRILLRPRYYPTFHILLEKNGKK